MPANHSWVNRNISDSINQLIVYVLLHMETGENYESE